MSESEKILDYLKSYAADNHEVLLSPIVSPIDDRVVSIEVSFNEKEYKRSNFGDVIDMVYETSKNVAWVTDSWIDYRRGSFTIKVNLAHENYNERWIIDTLEKLVKKLSSFRKKKWFYLTHLYPSPRLSRAKFLVKITFFSSTFI